MHHHQSRLHVWLPKFLFVHMKNALKILASIKECSHVPRRNPCMAIPSSTTRQAIIQHLNWIRWDVTWKATVTPILTLTFPQITLIVTWLPHLLHARTHEKYYLRTRLLLKNAASLWVQTCSQLDHKKINTPHTHLSSRHIQRQEFQ